MAFVDGNLGPRVRWAFADRADGVSVPPYDACNLADHVGDVVLVHRARRVVWAWVLTIPASGVVGAVSFYLIRLLRAL